MPRRDLIIDLWGIVWTTVHEIEYEDDGFEWSMFEVTADYILDDDFSRPRKIGPTFSTREDANEFAQAIEKAAKIMNEETEDERFEEGYVWGASQWRL